MTPSRDDLAEARALVDGWFARLRDAGAEEWRRAMTEDVAGALAQSWARGWVTGSHAALYDRDRGRVAALRLEGAAERWHFYADMWRRVAMILAGVLAAVAGALVVVAR